MTKLLQLHATAILAFVGQLLAAAEPVELVQSKPTVERKDGFFGIHLDLGGRNLSKKSATGPKRRNAVKA